MEDNGTVQAGGTGGRRDVHDLQHIPSQLVPTGEPRYTTQRKKTKNSQGKHLPLPKARRLMATPQGCILQ